ncbi:MAG: hypothetical protein ABUL64_02560 [Singulisphaera sp.]
MQVRRVEEAFHNRPSALLNVHVGDQVIRATHLHPFYVHERGWTHAKDLAVGESLLELLLSPRLLDRQWRGSRIIRRQRCNRSLFEH